ncbi:MAG: helix-turn-helix transcriptional regulator [Ferruginibacter sp.]
MVNEGVQQLFFKHIKSKLASHLSLVDEIAELLNISNDSAYRRIRGEKSVSFEELQKLCGHFKISLDSFLHLQSDSFIFNGKLKSAAENSFEEWLQNILAQLQLFNSYEKKHVYFLMKDIPPFVNFLMPELARFKYFFWMKSILHYKSLAGVKFELGDPRYDEYDVIVQKIVDLYLKVPMTEIWNVESIESTLRQIAFYQDAGAFKNPSDARLLYSKVEEMINHIERQAEHGLKFNIGQEPKSSSSEYRMYVNELILGDNTVLAELNDTRITFLNYGVLFIVHTRDERFNNAMSENLDNLIKKSMMVSKSGEKERVRFFNRLRERIYQYKGAG